MDERTGLTRGFPVGSAALVTYLMAGYPDRETSLASLREAARAGADVIEVGVPYGDALADGPIIADAAHVAIHASGAGFGLEETVALTAEFLRDPGTDEVPPVALMTYLNPMLRLGLEQVAGMAHEAGVAGFIVPDMPPDNPMAGQWLAGAAEAGLQTVFLVAPTSTPERLALAGSMTSGFLYCVPTTGTTGERDSVSGDLDALVSRARKHTTAPVAVGFGIGTPQQASQAARVADGVVVGSAIVRRQQDPMAVGSFIREMAAAVHGAR